MTHKVITCFFCFWTVRSFVRNRHILYWKWQWDLWLWDMLQSK